MIFLSLCLFFLDQRGWLGWLKRPLQKPLLAGEQKIYEGHLSFKKSLSIFSSKRQQAQKIDQLTSQLRQLAVDQNQLAVCRQENEQMRQLLGAPLPASWQFLPAKVIGFGEVLKIDQGKKTGVEKGMTVVSENILVGRVTQAADDYSLVATPLADETEIPVIFRGRPDELVIGRGVLTNQAGTLVLEKVLQEKDLQSGYWLLTSGEGDWLPDLLIGRVDEILAKPADVYKKAKVKPMLNYHQLRTVFVVRP